MKQRSQFLSTLCHYLDFDQYFFFKSQPFRFRYSISTKLAHLGKLRGSFVLDSLALPLVFRKIESPTHILVALFGDLVGVVPRPFVLISGCSDQQPFRLSGEYVGVDDVVCEANKRSQRIGQSKYIGLGVIVWRL